MNKEVVLNNNRRIFLFNQIIIDFKLQLFPLTTLKYPVQFQFPQFSYTHQKVRLQHHS